MKRSSLLLLSWVIFLHGCGGSVKQAATSSGTTQRPLDGSSSLRSESALDGSSNLGSERSRDLLPVQSNRADDRLANEALRRSILADPSMSVEARNIIITTFAGRMTLRGAVKNQSERQKIVASATQLSGITGVQDQLEPLDRSVATGNQAIQ
jgi:osmotically-inducible protein OsmY